MQDFFLAAGDPPSGFVHLQVRMFAGLHCTIVGEKASGPGLQGARGGHHIQPADFIVFFFHGYQVDLCDLVLGQSFSF